VLIRVVRWEMAVEMVVGEGEGWLRGERIEASVRGRWQGRREGVGVGSDVVVIDEAVVLFGVEVGGAAFGRGGFGRERRERMWVSFVERGVADAMVGRREGF